MADDRPPHDDDDRGPGFDVWLPAAAAIAAAFFMIAAAHAETPQPVSEPSPIYEAWRFDGAAVAREAAEAAASRATAETGSVRSRIAVTVVALPVLETALVASDPAVGATVAAAPAPPMAPVEPPRPSPGWGRLAAALGIAVLLASALIGIARVWHRTEPSLA